MPTRTMHGAMNGIKRLQGRQMGGWKGWDLNKDNAWGHELNGKTTRTMDGRMKGWYVNEENA